MRKVLSGICLLVMSMLSGYAQTQTPTPTSFTKEEQEVVNLSKDKWQWMADKNVDKLATLFDDKAKFVHMSGTWKKDEELEIIKSGTIWYKKATIHDTAMEMSGKTAIVWNRITLESEVRGSDAKVEFTVTEVYQKEGKNWKMLALTFSSVRDTHVIKH
ncbi:nuclear transport factor 2 family protein [Chryseolinea sp. T2]|uniref:nuclear transport factor 2 family protein n=1 Tax=Chryseolinea sp. T2 TaxID=3129255 RepID=UPI00307706EF